MSGGEILGLIVVIAIAAYAWGYDKGWDDRAKGKDTGL